MEEMSCKVLKNPSVFISSCMEAAIYDGMKLDVRRGTSEEMDVHLLEIVQSKRFSRTIIFCRGSAEVFKVEAMLSKVLDQRFASTYWYIKTNYYFFLLFTDWCDASFSSQSIYCV